MNSLCDLIGEAELEILARPLRIDEDQTPWPIVEQIHLEIVLGRTLLAADKCHDLAAGCVVELNRLAQEFVEVIADGRLIARGETVAVEGRVGIRITELVAGSDSKYLPIP